MGWKRATWLRQVAVLLLVVTCGLQCGCRAEAPWPLWDSYAQRFLDKQGRIIDHTGKDRTTSEGQAYAMFFALVAGDKDKFDKLLEWTEANLAQGDLTNRLPAWDWGKADDGTWRILDTHSAADADLWMAYVLCEAGRLWRVPRYDKLGTLLAARVAQQELVYVPVLGTTLLPGTAGFRPDAQTWVLNPSYLPMPLLLYFAKRDPQAPWKEVLETTPTVLHTQGGFVMDWMIATPTGIRGSVTPDKLAKGQTTDPAVGSYDAIRAYLWAGMSDPKADGTSEAFMEMRGMTKYMQSHPFPPLSVDSNGVVGTGDAPVGFSAALIPFLQSLGMKPAAKVQMDRLVALKDEKTGLYGHDLAYYDQNLALFGLGWTEGRFRFEKDGKLKVKWK